MSNPVLNLKPTSNLALVGPYELTLEEFEALPVSDECMNARQLIYQLEDHCLNNTAESRIYADDLTPVHWFVDGFYMRELTMPPGTIIVGRRHARAHLVRVETGKCWVFTERGSELIEAPAEFMSPAGEKRVVQVLEETTWVTIHPTSATNLDDVELELILNERPQLELNRPTRELEVTP